MATANLRVCPEALDCARMRPVSPLLNLVFDQIPYLSNEPFLLLIQLWCRANKPTPGARQATTGISTKPPNNYSCHIYKVFHIGIRLISLVRDRIEDRSR